jgi:hypothetical protein
MYLVFDEEGYAMRKVTFKQEAKALIVHRPGWTYKKIEEPKIDLDKFEPAPY